MGTSARFLGETQCQAEPSSAASGALVMLGALELCACGLSERSSQTHVEPQPPPTIDAGAGGSGPSTGGAAGEPARPVDRPVTPVPAEISTLVDGGLVDFEQLAPTCRVGMDGSWVCVFQAGREVMAGPCDFHGDGGVSAGLQVVWSDTQVTAVLASLAAGGDPLWQRGWHRDGPLAGLTIRINGVAVDERGHTFWGGEDCVPAQPGELIGCSDAVIAELGPGGDLVEWRRFGTPHVLDRVSDLRLSALGDLFVGGQFWGPLELPGLEPVESNFSDLYVFAMRDGIALWASTWGGQYDDWNGVRLAEDSEGGVLASLHTTMMPTPYPDPSGPPPPYHALVASLSADGTVRWEADVPNGYISYVAALDDGRAVVQAPEGFLLIGESGVQGRYPSPPGLGIAKLRRTASGTVAMGAQQGVRAGVSDGSNVIYSLDAGGGTVGLWYHGGLCTAGDGSIGVTGTVTEPSDFGILVEPIAVTGTSAFLLVLKQPI